MKDMIVQEINVLSLFDGMSCGQIALDKMGVKVGNYYASEIDKFAIQVTKHNYPNTQHMGDVTKWKQWDIDFSSIDLVLAGSPCQGFSFVGKQLAFDDPRSALFFTFVDILNHIRSLNPEVKFLLENVKMKKEYQDVITDVVGVDPIEINSRLVSAQNRRRLYWTNVDGVCQPEDKGILVKDIIQYEETTPNGDGWHKWWSGKSEFQLRKQYSCIMNDNEKSICMTARQMASWNGNLVRVGEGKLRFATPIECERLQNVPDGYTSCVSNTQAYKMLGNGWTVDVITHLLRGMFEDIDLFEHYETLPKEVQQLILEFPEDGCMYRNSDKLIEDLEKIGYTCDYDLSGEPYGLKKIEEK